MQRQWEAKTHKARQRHVHDKDNDWLIVATMTTAVKVDDAPERVQQNKTQRQKCCTHHNKTTAHRSSNNTTYMTSLSRQSTEYRLLPVQCTNMRKLTLPLSHTTDIFHRMMENKIKRFIKNPPQIAEQSVHCIKTVLSKISKILHNHNSQA